MTELFLRVALGDEADVQYAEAGLCFTALKLILAKDPVDLYWFFCVMIYMILL